MTNQTHHVVGMARTVDRARRLLTALRMDKRIQKYRSLTLDVEGTDVVVPVGNAGSAVLEHVTLVADEIATRLKDEEFNKRHGGRLIRTQNRYGKTFSEDPQ